MARFYSNIEGIIPIRDITTVNFLGAVVGGGLGLAGNLIGADSAEKAASQQADAITRAQEISQEAALKARTDIMTVLNPAFTDFAKGLQEVESTIKQGTVDIMDIFSNSTWQASNILTNAGMDAKRALLGSKAASEGMPRQTFVADYAKRNMAALPSPEAGTPRGIQDLQRQDTIDKATADRLAADTELRDAEAALGRIQTASPYGRMDRGTQEGLSDYDRQQMETGQADAIAAAQARVDAARTSATERAEAATLAETAGATTSPYGPTPTRTSALPLAPQSVVDRATQQMGETIPLTQGPDGVYTAAPEAMAPGYYDAKGTIERGYGTALGQLTRGAEQARGDIYAGRESSLEAISRQRGDIVRGFDPYTSAGASAMQREAALSGALGPEAQQQAMNAFIESPGQKYLREQQEKALLRNQAAIGGLQGGNVRTALQEQAMGIAATQQQQYLENLRNISGRGQQAVGTQAGLTSQLTGLETGVQQQTSQQLAAIADSLGVRAADLTRMTSAELAQLSERTGVRLADLEAAVGTAQAGLTTQWGSQLAGVAGGALGDITNLQTQRIQGTTQGQVDLATMLANLATQSGTQLAGLEANKGSATAAGTAMKGQTWMEGLQGLGSIAAYGLESQQPTITPTATPTATPTVDQLPMQQYYH